MSGSFLSSLSELVTNRGPVIYVMSPDMPTGYDCGFALPERENAFHFDSLQPFSSTFAVANVAKFLF